MLISNKFSPLWTPQYFFLRLSLTANQQRAVPPSLPTWTLVFCFTTWIWLFLTLALLGVRTRDQKLQTDGLYSNMAYIVGLFGIFKFSICIWKPLKLTLGFSRLLRRTHITTKNTSYTCGYSLLQKKDKDWNQQWKKMHSAKSRSHQTQASICPLPIWGPCLIL